MNENQHNWNFISEVDETDDLLPFITLDSEKLGKMQTFGKNAG